MKSKYCYISNRYFFSLLLLLTFISRDTIIARTIKDTFKKNITFNQGGYLSLTNVNGNIEISSWENSEVEIVAHKEVRVTDAEHAEELMEKLKIIVTENVNEIQIETELPRRGRGSGFFDWLFEKGNGSYSVSYEIKVPIEIDLNINTTNGNIEIQDIKGRIRMKSTNGGITAQGIKGFIRCKTTNGSVRAKFDQIPGDDQIYFKTTNGSVKLYLPKDYAGEVDLKTTNGKIETDFPLTIHEGWSSKHVSGSISEGDGEIECTTTNGNISLYYNDQT
jgi:DUF4097 and DUF4098 domain-containing protein YvlB